MDDGIVVVDTWNGFFTISPDGTVHRLPESISAGTQLAELAALPGRRFVHPAGDTLDRIA